MGKIWSDKTIEAFFTLLRGGLEEKDIEYPLILSEKEWEDMRKKASVLLKFDKLSEIDRIVSHTCVLVSNGSEDVQPQMAELIHMLDILRKSEMP